MQIEERQPPEMDSRGVQFSLAFDGVVQGFLMTTEALDDLEQGNLNGAEYLVAFEKHKAQIHQIARKAFSAGRRDGRVVLETRWFSS